MEMDDPRLTERPLPQPKPRKRSWRAQVEPVDVLIGVAILAGALGFAFSPWPWLAGIYIAAVLFILVREAL